MAKKLNTSGVPVDAPTIRPRAHQPLVANEDQSQDPPFFDEVPTRPITSRPGRPSGGFGPIGNDPHTVIAGGFTKGTSPVTQPGTRDPVVGWLVVIDGPGKGSSIQIGNGQNTIGRSPESRIRLDFGDPQISRNDHAVISYDNRANRFYIQQHTGVNLVYLEDDPVLGPTILENGSRISMGGTTLRFVAFCDDKFRWGDTDLTTPES